MKAEELLVDLECKDTSEAYKALLELEKLSESSDALYAYTQRFAQLALSEKYAVRVRGFRLFCKQARWDSGGVIDRCLDDALTILNDDKPTAVRQALAAFCEVVRFKPGLALRIQAAIGNIDCRRYKDTVRGLILKDIEALQAQINKARSALATAAPDD